MAESLSDQVTPERTDLDDELAAALQRGAEQAAGISIEDVFDQARRDYVEMTAADDGKTPDVLVMIMSTSDIAYHTNGVTTERAAWIAGSFIHALRAADLEPPD